METTPQAIPAEESHCVTILSWIKAEGDHFYWTANAFEYPLPVDVFTSHLRQSKDPNADFACFGLRDENGALCGYFELTRIDPLNRSVRLSRMIIGPAEKRGSGLGVQAVGTALQQAFSADWVHRIELAAFIDNIPAVRCYQRAGFTIEGTQREAAFFRTTPKSLYTMSLLRPEWESRKDR